MKTRESSASSRISITPNSISVSRSSSASSTSSSSSSTSSSLSSQPADWPSDRLIERVIDEIDNLKNIKFGQESICDDTIKKMFAKNQAIVRTNNNDDRFSASTAKFSKSNFVSKSSACRSLPIVTTDLPWNIDVDFPFYNQKQLVRDCKLDVMYAHRRAELRDVAFELPRMTAWAPVQCNVSFDEEIMLHHVPYLGEDVATTEEEGFIDDLAQSYDGLVYGHNLASDAKLYHLVQRLLISNVPNPGAVNSPSSTETPITLDNVFALLVAVFDSQGFKPDDLARRYRSFCEQLAVKEVAPTIMKNLDTDHFERPYSFKETMDSYQRLFCRRCYQYDCGQHKNYSYTPLYRAQEDKALAYHAACKQQCFLEIREISIEDYIVPTSGSAAAAAKRLDSSSASSSSAASSSSSSSSASSADDDEDDPHHHHHHHHDHHNHHHHHHPHGHHHHQHERMIKKTIALCDVRRGHWTNIEKTLFNVLMPTMKQNYCKIAGTMATKTCAEVYVYATEEADERMWSIPASVSVDRHKNRRAEKRCCPRKVWKRVGKTLPTDGELPIHYEPCDHIGRPCDDRCVCVRNKVYCEKFCNCVDCPHRFPGCQCKATCQTKACPCFVALRECDPDLCTSCGSHYLQEDKIRCRNIPLQRRHRKHLLLGPSDVAGWGCFINGTAEKDELISEYCGEMITHDDAERRGKLYDKDKCSYLFDLNSELVIDAKRKGNKIRFANHSVNPNCYARVRMVNGDSRIGIYANRKLERFQELFFDYRYGENQKLAFVSKELN